MAMATCPSKSFSDQTSRRSPHAPRFMALMADRKDAPKALQLYLYTLLSTFRRSHRGEAGGHQSMRAACGRVCGVSIRLCQLLRCWQRRVRNVQSADFYYVPSSASLKGKARPRVEGSSVSSLRVRSCACHQGWARLGCKRSRLWSVAEVQLKSSYQKKRKRSSGLSLLRSLFRVLDQASSKQAAM